MKEIINKYLEQKQDNSTKLENNELFCNILIKELQQIQAKDLAKELISVVIEKSDKSINLKFKLL